MDERLIYEINIRWDKCRIEAAARGFDALMVVGQGTERAGNLKFLANHTPALPGHPRRYSFRGRGCSFMLLPVTGKPVMGVTTPFYEYDIAVEDVRFSNNLIALFGEMVREKGMEHADIGLVGMDILPVALYWDLIKELPGVKFYPADDIVMNIRSRKSEYEIEQLRIGAKLADITAKGLKDILKPGARESEVGKYIRDTLTENGATSPFATCQSGKRSREPYPNDRMPCSDKIIEDGDMVHMEINGFYNGYQIDVCRSTVVGHMKKEQEFILNLCCEMLEKSIQAARPGIRAEELELITGELALKHNLGRNHTATYGGPGTYLGHAIGLGVDEPPCLAKGDKTILVPGMVLTLEPGIYRTEWGGCRIEDEVLITETGYEVLNHYGRRLWEE
ncbi:MAG: Xaa-Pro peptidase family protein [Clostridia bacterium]|nr:Xaa-Pro peptidase family protein [Clostridia bacterium]